ncbi:unnamed protein product, partial [Gulo gulo]
PAAWACAPYPWRPHVRPRAPHPQLGGSCLPAGLGCSDKRPSHRLSLGRASEEAESPAEARPGGGFAGRLRQKDKGTKDKGRSCKTRTTTVSSHTPCRPGRAHGRTEPDGCPASPGPCRLQRRAEAPPPGRPRAALQSACRACRRRRCCAPAACVCCWRA